MSNPYKHLKYAEGKNYIYKKEFCPLLGIEYKVGKAQRLQLKQIEQYMEIVKNGRNVFIKKIYEKNEIELIENRGKYLTHIENFLVLLLSEFTKNGEKYVIMTNRDILEMATIVNPNYFLGMNNIFKFADNFKIGLNDKDLPNETYAIEKIIDESGIFFSASYRLFKRIIYDCLVSMEKRSLILKNKTFVCYRNYKDKDNFWKSERYECSDNDIERILGVQHKTITAFNETIESEKFYVRDLDSTYALNPYQRHELKKIMNENFREEFKEEGYTACSKAFKLNLSSNVAFEHELETRIFDSKRLNNNIQTKLLEAKDLQAVGETLRKQFINKFIKNE